ncbi:polysaccharide deacetylase family protein [Plantactinospora sp. BC1]|uniref:polysaccharide deacetylase family protein n=1 Tax=Plantactinospora sp. BC1 TaxID=2108470 RepID=UPI001F20648C|nr:polysaccharide deacetylase family protein [Plantactinospora sp. BC1]
MPTMSRTRMLTIATLVAVTVLGGAYALGHTLGRPGGPLAARPESRAQHQADGATDQHSADRAGGPAEGRADPGQTGGPTNRPADPALPAPSATVPPSGAAQPADPDRTRAHEPPRLPAEQDGPHGARISTGASYVALTFDDGPDPRYTPQILAALADYHVKATFCLVGENAQAHPELVRAIVAEGHTLCNHSWRHDIGLGSRPSASIRADLVRTNEAIRAAVPDARIDYFRQPGGAWTASVVAVARQLEMTSLHWAVDPQDWTRPGAGAIAARVSAGVRPGAIVLLHDAGGNRQGTLVALRWLLPDLARRYALAALPSGPPSAGTPSAGTPSPGEPPQGRAGGATPPAGRPAAGTPSAGQPVRS